MVPDSVRVLVTVLGELAVLLDVFFLMNRRVVLLLVPGVLRLALRK